MTQAYLGPQHGEAAIRAAIHGLGMKVRECKDMEECVRETAGIIEGGAVLGWYQGRSEWGPRALGNRSILANPAIPDMKERINRKIKKHHHEALASASAIQTMADGLPAIGIVAAVLGVIKTMSSIDQPPEVLGGMIGGALVGTFLGVFIAYCMVQPISGRLKQIEDEDGAFYSIIRDIFVAMVANYAPSICVEIGRGNIPTSKQPDFYKVEAAQKELPAI